MFNPPQNDENTFFQFSEARAWPGAGIVVGRFHIDRMSFAPGFENRNGIVIETSSIAPDEPAVFACNASADKVFNDPTDGQDRACNFLNWNDLAAYLQWAALRPMTELEFEKICRPGFCKYYRLLFK